MSYTALITAIAVCSFFASAPAWAQTWQDRPEISALFEKNGVTGTFVVYDPEAETLTGHNRTRAETRFIPASTFKIPNSVIGLSVGAVKNVDETLPYGGQAQPIKAWERDMGLREAIEVSNVAVYQELARRIGWEAMRLELRKIGYGNDDIGSKVDLFWLEGPLAISALEQVRFLSKLARGQLPQSESAQKQVRDILLIEQGEGWALYAKTGLALRSSPRVGWWVGWVEQGPKIYPFALNMEIKDLDSDGPKRLELGRAGLKLMGLGQ